MGSQRGQQPVEILPIIEELARRQAPAWLNDLLLVQAEEHIFRQAGFHYGTDEIEYLRDRLDRMEPTELHLLEHAFAQLNAVERGNLEEKQRAVDLHLLIVTASRKRVIRPPVATAGAEGDRRVDPGETGEAANK